jgi:tetratricopeptide (TPR) repeat protein
MGKVKRRNPPRASTPPPEPRQAEGRLSRGKKVLFAVVAILLGCVLLEGFLFICGVQPELYENDPYVGFSSQTPLFVPERGAGGEVFMVTARNKLPFFNAQRFLREKASGVFRVFSLGGSTAYGHPYSDATSFNGWLREYLRALAPGRPWEVINAGGISYGSYRDARLMEELIHYRPDLFVLYESQNEFLERRIYTKLRAAPRLIRELAGLAARTRTATLMKRVARFPGHGPAAGTAGPTVLQSEPATLLEERAGLAAYTRDDALRQQILEHYGFNLRRMVDIAASVGAKVIFIVPASNLREASPFKSEHRPGLSPADLRQWQEYYEAARRDYANPSPTNALPLLDRAAALDDLAANLHFLRGRVFEKLGRYAEAKAAYERARDEDVCPLRAPREIRQILTRVATERQVPLVDFEALLAARCDHGILDARVFLDHVHPTIEGYRWLALEILKVMERTGIVHPFWDQEQIQRTTQEVMGRINVKSHAFALMNLCKTLGWAGKLEEAYRAGVRAVELDPDNVDIQYESGLAALQVAKYEEAAAHFHRALELKPDHANAHNGMGFVLEHQGQLAEAIAQLRLALKYGTAKDRERDQRNLDKVLAEAGQSPPP